jgi:pimeloyl-ACP methyl ester carboxylesterase
MTHDHASRILDVGDIRLQVFEAGPMDGEPVILLHGFPEFWWGWQKQIPALADAGFRVIALDCRGYGGSDAPSDVEAYKLDRLVDDVMACAAALGFARFNLVGHDWGGIIAFAAAARHPISVTRLVVLNAPHLDVMKPFLRSKPSQLLRSAYVGFFQLPGLPEALLSARDFKLLSQALTRTSRPGTFGEQDLERYRTEWARPGRLHAMLNYYRALVRKPAPPLGRIVPPTMILWGCKDQALDAGLARESLLQCTNGRMHSHRGATHWIQHEEPAWVNDHLIRFLSEDQELERPAPGLADETI